MRQCARIDVYARDCDASHAIERDEGDRAARRLDIAVELRTRWLGSTGRQVWLTHFGAVTNFRNECDPVKCIANVDRQRCGRGISVTIGQLVCKYIADAAWRVEIAHVGVSAISTQIKLTILARNGGPDSLKAARGACAYT